MGKKKRSQRAKQPPPPPVSTIVESGSRQVAETEINNEGLRDNLQQDSPNFHCREAVMHCALAARAQKGTYKELNAYNNAAHSVELAVKLLPNSVEISFFLAVLRWKLAAINDKEWDKVIEVCESTLKIENPDDTLLDSKVVYIIGGFLGIENWEMLNKESRIAIMKQQIMKFLLESWRQRNHELEGQEKENDMVKEDVMGLEMTAMKAVGKDKEDNMIKEDLIGLEERKKQIKAIIKELEQQMTCYNDEKFDKTYDKEVKFNPFWSSGLSSEAKRDFLKVNIEELTRHVKSLQNRFVVEMFSEALSFAKEHKAWRFSECYCSEKFGASHLYKNHFRGLHWKNHEMMVQSLTKIDITSEWIEMIKNGIWKPVDTDVAVETIVNEVKSDSIITVKLPLYDYSKRAELLKSIRRRFLFLLQHRLVVMAKRVVHWAIQFAIYKFEVITSLSQFKYHSLKIHKVIGCLGASQLEELLDFMHGLVNTCGLDESSSLNIFVDNRYIGLNIKESVVFNGDSSCFLLDERLLRGELTNANYSDAVADEGSAVTSSVDVRKDHVIPDANEIVSWLYLCPTTEDYSRLWTRQRNSKRGKAKEALGIFSDEGLHLTTAESRFSKLSGKMEAVQAVESICIEETKNREKFPEHVAQPYLELLKKQKNHLQGNDDNVSKTKSDTISHVLKEAEAAVSSDQSGFEEMDNCIKLSLQKLKMQVLKNMASVDGAILRRMDILLACKRVIDKLSLYDYRSVIVPILKSFLQARLEDLFDKDAKEKNINEGYDNVKQKQENMGNKKKKKNFRKAEESKANESDQNFQLPEKEPELNGNPNSKVDENADALIATDETKLEEHHRQFGHEASLRVNKLGTGFTNEAAVLSDNPNSKVGENADELIATEEREVEAHPEHQKQFEHEASLRVDELGTGFTNEAADVCSPVLSENPNSEVGENADEWMELQRKINEYLEDANADEWTELQRMIDEYRED